MSHPHPEPSGPPPLPAGALRVTPLGGLGEIGRNMTVFEYGGKLLIVDCGVLFPEEAPPGTVFHTGDFKMDQLPLDNRLTDLATIAELGKAGIDLLLSDSTNAEVPGFVTAEREITPVLDRVFGRAKGRIIVASFASHVHRVQQVCDVAAAHGRKVALVGRSMVRNMAVARDLGYLKVPA